MSAFRHFLPFRTIRNSTAPSFNAGSSAVFDSTTSAFESTALSREWKSANHAVRLAEDKGIDYYVNFGSSTITANSSESMLLLGGTVETFVVEGGQDYIAIKSVSTSTGAKVNVTLGHGG